MTPSTSTKWTVRDRNVKASFRSQRSRACRYLFVPSTTFYINSVEVLVTCILPLIDMTAQGVRAAGLILLAVSEGLAVSSYIIGRRSCRGNTLKRSSYHVTGKQVICSCHDNSPSPLYTIMRSITGQFRLHQHLLAMVLSDAMSNP